MALWRSEEGGSGSRAVEEMRSAAIWQSSANQPCSIWSGCRRVARSRHDVHATGGARVKTPVRTAVPSPLVHVERWLLVEQTIVPRYRTSSMSQRARAISSRRMSSTESSAASSAGRGRERSKGARALCAGAGPPRPPIRRCSRIDHTAASRTSRLLAWSASQWPASRRWLGGGRSQLRQRSRRDDE